MAQEAATDVSTSDPLALQRRRDRVAELHAIGVFLAGLPTAHRSGSTGDEAANRGAAIISWLAAADRHV